MGARRDLLNQALLDQRRSSYWGTIQPGCYQRWRTFVVTAYGTAMGEQGVSLDSYYFLIIIVQILTSFYLGE